MARRLCTNLNFPKGEINFLFTTNLEIRKYQWRFFKKKNATDVITFADGPWIDIIISLDQAVAQARPRGAKLSQELMLLMCHGLLHAKGFEDQTGAGWLRMRQAEFESLAKTL